MIDLYFNEQTVVHRDLPVISEDIEELGTCNFTGFPRLSAYQITEKDFLQLKEGRCSNKKVVGIALFVVGVAIGVIGVIQVIPMSLALMHTLGPSFYNLLPLAAGIGSVFVGGMFMAGGADICNQEDSRREQAFKNLQRYLDAMSLFMVERGEDLKEWHNSRFSKEAEIRALIDFCETYPAKGSYVPPSPYPQEEGYVPMYPQLTRRAP